MNKKALLTIAVGDRYTKISEKTHKYLKNYANKIEADFIVIDESNKSTPHWEKFIIYNLLNKYERILYIDTDIIIRDDCPNLFDEVPYQSLGAFDEFPFVEGRQNALSKACIDYNIPLKSWNGKYYNTGVMVISRPHKEIFEKPKMEISNFYEQSYLNVMINKYKTKMFDLDYKFNRMTCMDRFTGEDRHASYIIHYAGSPNLNMLYSLINNDLNCWENASPDYKFMKHILVSVQGGLGDQVCAEPVIRFMKNNVYPDDEIIIKTHYPKLFKHLNLKTFNHKNFIQDFDKPYYVTETVPNPEENPFMWKCVSHLMSHSIDFISMSVLRRILPLKDKKTILSVDLKDMTKVLDILGTIDLNNLVLVHPGRSWESKTFPKNWWQEVIDNLADKVPLCLIGKDTEDTGTVDIDVPENVLDTRNLLDLDALIALISVANIVISNDSAPVHIAGAFETDIVLIPTCKHPEHILPWRKDKTGCFTQKYKTNSLYKKLTSDDKNSQPTLVHGSLEDKVKSNFLDHLPEPKEVVDKILEVKNRTLR